MLSIHQGSPRRLWERITLRTRKAWSFPLQFRRRKQDSTDEKDCIYFARITDLLTGPFPRHAKFLNHPLITLENQHLHGVIRHWLGHVPICDSICIQIEFVHGFQHCYFLKYIRRKGINDCYQVQLFSGVKCKHQLTRDFSAWLNKRLMYHTLSAAKLEIGKWNYKHKAKT